MCKQSDEKAQVSVSLLCFPTKDRRENLNKNKQLRGNPCFDSDDPSYEHQANLLGKLRVHCSPSLYKISSISRRGKLRHFALPTKEQRIEAMVKSLQKNPVFQAAPIRDFSVLISDKKTQ